MAKCFKCEKEVKSAVKGESSWDMPCGVNFTGGGNFGSGHYDTFMDGISVKLVVCDECLMAHQELLRHRKLKHYASGWGLSAECSKCPRAESYICDKNGNEIPEQLELSFEEKKDERKESR